MKKQEKQELQEKLENLQKRRLELYRLGVKAFLENDFATVKEIYSALPERSPMALLLEIRLLFRSGGPALSKKRLEELEPFEPQDDLLLGDFNFWNGRVAHALDEPSAQHFQKAAEIYHRANRTTEYIRALMNATLEWLEKNEYLKVLSACDRAEAELNSAEEDRASLIIYVLRTRLRALTSLCRENEALAVIYDLKKSPAFETLPRRDQAIVLLSEADSWLNLGMFRKAEVSLEEATVLLGEPDVTETFKFLEWRISWQKSRISPPIDFDRNSVLLSFKSKAQALVEIALQGRVMDRSDYQVDQWLSEPWARTTPPEIKYGQKDLRWDLSRALLSDSIGTPVARFFRMCKPARLLDCLVDGPRSKWDLLEAVLGVSPSVALRNRRYEHDLYIQVRKLNARLPGLVLNESGTYRLGRSVKRGMHGPA